MINPKLTAALACLICTTTLFSQHLKYELILLGKNIGSVTIDKKAAGTFTQYTVNSHSYVKIMTIEKKDDMITQATFSKQGKLVSSSYKDVKNDQRLSTTSTTKEGKLLVIKDGAKSTITEAVTSSSAMLFFREPKDHQRMFSERLGQVNEVAKQDNGKYKVAYEGYTAIYTYESGKLTELEMREAAGSVTMKLVK